MSVLALLFISTSIHNMRLEPVQVCVQLKVETPIWRVGACVESNAIAIGYAAVKPLMAAVILVVVIALTSND